MFNLIDPGRQQTVNISQGTQQLVSLPLLNLLNPGFKFTGSVGGAQAPTQTPTPAAAPTVTVSASDLQFIIASIPEAQDGHVITADHHNAMVFALRALATRLGLGATAGTSVIVVPKFQKRMSAHNVTISEWEVDTGFVKKTNTNPATAIFGWMEVELPNDARILSMEVFGTKQGTGTVRVELVRQKISDVTISEALIRTDIPDGHDATRPTPPADVTLPGRGAGPQTIAEYRVIDTENHKYIVTAEVIGGDTALTARISAVKISCGF